MLRGSAGAALALPWLEAMAGRRAHAQATPKRLVVVVSVLGTYPEHFWPRPSGSPPWAPTNQPLKNYATGTTALDSTNFQLEPICEPLEAHKQDLLFVEGINPTNCTGHAGYCNMLTGTRPLPAPGDNETAGGLSVDQLVASRIGKETRFASLQIGVGAGGSPHYGTVSWYAARMGLPADPDPRSVWQRVFANVAAGGGAVDNSALVRVLNQRKLVLDGALGQANALKKRLGAADQTKLDNYLDSFRDLQMRVTRVSPGGSVATGCAKPASPVLPKNSVPAAEIKDYKTDTWPDIGRLQIENLAMAFTCDLTRVATLQIGFEGMEKSYPWLGFTTTHHSLSHTDYDKPEAPRDYANIGKIQRFNAQLVSALATRLKQIPEGSGTVFDNTVVLWFNSLTLGSTHGNNNTPVLLVGSAGRYFRPGRHVRFPSNGRRTMADLSVQIARSMGLADISTFGDPRFNLGSMDGLRA
jgi:hypothetical protein